MLNAILIAAGVLLGSGGAILLKIGSSSIAQTNWSSFESVLRHLVLNPYIVGGFACYFLPALIWIYLMARMPISVLQPILSLTYVVTPVLAIFFLREPVPTVRWLGIAVIIAGVTIVGLGR